MLPPFDILLACTPSRGIGYLNRLPWHLPSDLRTFKRITLNGTVIMGRRTFQSIGHPLPHRTNIILTSQQRDGIHCASSLSDALWLAKEMNPLTNIFVIGGKRVFEEALSHSSCRYVYETQLADEVKCDVYAPDHSMPLIYVSKTYKEGGIRYDYRQYYNQQYITHTTHHTTHHTNAFDAPPHEQMQYIHKVKHIIENGEVRANRTSTPTRSLFGGMMRYDLAHTFPLLTHKRVFWRGVVEELLFFLNGRTDNKLLEEKNVHIWREHSSKEYLQSLNQQREAGDLGPVYGYQWRHWGAPYVDCHTDYTDKGIDQLSRVISQLRSNPTSRRMVVSAWNPSQLDEMALPPCHMMYQLHVTNDGRLNCMMYQRSADMGLGVPFNIASYALLTCILAHITNLKRGQLVHTMGDMHVYEDHVQKLKNISEIVPYAFPEVEIDQGVKCIEDLSWEKIRLKGYKSHGKIEMKMAV